MTRYNQPEIALKEWGMKSTDNGWSIMISGQNPGDGKFLGDGSFVNLDLHPETTREEAERLITLLGKHCRDIALTEV